MPYAKVSAFRLGSFAGVIVGNATVTPNVWGTWGGNLCPR